jgi:4-amino-4-deoxy-L-arabinose transferase-like glycosyltransferase
MHRLEERLASHARWVVAGLIAASAILRIVYFIQIDGGPCSQWQRWEDGDPNFFDQWGRRIASGDWLGDTSFHPLHTWHKRVAWEHFNLNRGEEIDYRKRGVDPARALWDRWYGEKLYHQEPLYPYLVGATYRVFGPDPRAVYVWQMALGILSNLLIWWIARRHFGDVAGLLAGLLAVFCGPILFYEMTLVRTSLTVFATLFLYAVFDRAFDRDTLRLWFAAGAALGAAMLLQTTFFLFGLGALALFLAKKGRQARPVAAAAAGAVLCLTPVFVRNAVVGAPLFGFSSVGTVTFVAANWPDTDPTRGWAVDDRALAGVMSDTGGSFGAAVRNTLDRHTPWSFGDLLWRKSKMLLHDYELPNNKNFLYFRLHAPVLHAGPVGFGLILPFAMIGLVAAWKRPERPWLLFVLVASAVAPMLLFYVLARFRAPLAAALIPFAALGGIRMFEWIGQKRWKAVGIGSAVVVLAGLAMFRPLPPHMREIRSADYRIAFKTFGGPRERAAVESSNWEGASAVLAQTLGDEPEEVRRMDGTPLPEGGFEIRQIADFFRAVHSRRAEYLSRAGRPDEARKDAERAEILKRSLGGVPAAPWEPDVKK